ncbi:MAG TPA: hypothetical protein VKV05_05150 [Terriglobales bacterium]|nr:hypothetical protein [Terriglobales bacterium]
MLESLAGTANLLVRVFAILAALSALVYVLFNWQLQKANRRESDERLEAESRRAGWQAELSKAQDQVEESKRENQRLTAELEQERQVRLEIQRRFGPRGLSSATSADIVTALEPFRGQKVNFAYFADVETAAFAQQLLDLLTTAGWKPQPFKLKSMQPLYGIQFGGPNPGDGAFAALAGALKLADRHATPEDNMASTLGQAVPPQLTDQLWVLVGLKRPMHFRQPLPDAPQPSGNHGTADRN